MRPATVDRWYLLTGLTPLLGTVPYSKQVYADYILSKNPEMSDEEFQAELAKVPDLEEKGWTGFLTLTGEIGGPPALSAHMFKGAFKEICTAMRRGDANSSAGSVSRKLRAHKKQIDQLVWVRPRFVPLLLPEGRDRYLLTVRKTADSDGEERESEFDISERPLRAQTAQGERVALARSDACPAGTQMLVNIQVRGGSIMPAHIMEWFEFLEGFGMGQWRGSGQFGNMTYSDVTDVIAENPKTYLDALNGAVPGLNLRSMDEYQRLEGMDANGARLTGDLANVKTVLPIA